MESPSTVAQARWLGATLALAPALVASSCQEPTWHYELRLAGSLPASVRPRASYRGTSLELGRVGAGRFVARFDATGRGRVSRHLGMLRVGVPTACGWIETPFRPATFAASEAPRFRRLLEDEERIVGRHGRRVVLSTFLGDLPLPPRLAISVDWRQASASAQVALGELPLRRGSGLGTTRAPQDAELFVVFAPTCALGRRVLLDGKTIATLSAAESAGGGVIVIDVAGGHCYRRSTRRYAAAAASQPRAASTTTPAPFEQLELRVLRDRRVHAARPAPPLGETSRPFPECPGFLPGQVRCAELRPHDCQPPAAQETPR